MPKYDRYLLSQFLSLFGFFSLVLVAVYWVNRAVSLFDRLIANGHSAAVFLEFSLLALPNVVRLVLPVAAFAAAVWVANRMRAESELVIAQAAGLSPMRGARAAVVFGATCAVITLILTHVLAPIAEGRLDVRDDEIAMDVSAGLLTPGQFIHPVDGVTLFIDEIGNDGTLGQVFLSDRRSEKRQTTYTADRAILASRDGEAFLVLFDGLSQTLNYETNRLETTSFDEYTVRVDPGGSEGGGRVRLGGLPTIAIMADFAGTVAATGDTPREIATEIAERTSQGLQSFVAPILGFAAMMLGGFSRFSAWRQVTGAIVALVIYELAYRVTFDAALNTTAPVWVILLPSLAFAALSLACLQVAGMGRIGRGRRIAP
ncbi:lipopolysaccharide export system permease protein [Palleronia marisminoris]|uniref:Putative permease YjgP/YjgQ family protein n=1 Tax=Palleronia marisminoris TaxID=315423 RepID=A0A1Y5TDA0_9RHOB|nr:LPS export ABC transporter permease LptF [Palleronia marisminoris]SFH22315.1 lipopolysaccharide export system permease protein [Palleronia marisminoris]SLN57803.1 putative permease YjgP/YjgQ family protein [Palleronia marisminoris]